MDGNWQGLVTRLSIGLGAVLLLGLAYVVLNGLGGNQPAPEVQAELPDASTAAPQWNGAMGDGGASGEGKSVEAPAWDGHTEAPPWSNEKSSVAGPQGSGDAEATPWSLPARETADIAHSDLRRVPAVAQEGAKTPGHETTGHPALVGPDLLTSPEPSVEDSGPAPPVGGGYAYPTTDWPEPYIERQGRATQWGETPLKDDRTADRSRSQRRHPNRGFTYPSTDHPTADYRQSRYSQRESTYRTSMRDRPYADTSDRPSSRTSQPGVARLRGTIESALVKPRNEQSQSGVY